MAMLFPHVATTGDIHVRVAVSYLPEQSALKAGRWFWSYHIGSRMTASGRCS